MKVIRNKTYFSKVLGAYAAEYSKSPTPEDVTQSRMTNAKRKRIQRLGKYTTRAIIG